MRAAGKKLALWLTPGSVSFRQCSQRGKGRGSRPLGRKAEVFGFEQSLISIANLDRRPVMDLAVIKKGD